MNPKKRLDETHRTKNLIFGVTFLFVGTGSVVLWTPEAPLGTVDLILSAIVAIVSGFHTMKYLSRAPATGPAK